MAARNIEKVKLLIARGADINAPASTGITPLMVAARFKGNSEVVRFLLKNGAVVNPKDNIEIRNDASALFFGVIAGDIVTVQALLDAGAAVAARMRLVGQYSTSPLLYATTAGDTAMVECLIRNGADPDDVDADGISALSWATLTNHPKTAEALLNHGAQVNRVDKLGMTPLLYAASIDFGDTEVLEALIDSGADWKTKNSQGLTAFDLAVKYKHTAPAKLLAEKEKPPMSSRPRQPVRIKTRY